MIGYVIKVALHRVHILAGRGTRIPHWGTAVEIRMGFSCLGRFPARWYIQSLTVPRWVSPLPTFKASMLSLQRQLCWHPAPQPRHLFSTFYVLIRTPHQSTSRARYRQLYFVSPSPPPATTRGLYFHRHGFSLDTKKTEVAWIFASPTPGSRAKRRA
jgi:hypothetical protein